MSGRINDADLEEVRRKASLVEIAQQYMKVRQAGRLYKALCPFHAEKTPSFSLDPAKNLWYCFGCGKGGDVIGLVQQLENLQFVETVELLARKTGVTLRYEQLTPAERERSKTRSRLIDAHREAVAFYHDALMKSPEAKPARDYLSKRGLKKESVERFRVGYSPGAWDSLVTHLKSKGFKDAEMVDASLALRTERGGLIDRFRGRLMFPTFDVTGEPRAFGARKLKDTDDGPKYLNSSETPIFKKGTHLYGLNWAKAEIVKADMAVVVEGYTDVIMLHQSGVGIAVASNGTALSVDHFALLSRFSKQVVIALDADQAGQTAAERAVERAFLDAQDRDANLRVLELPAGSDPASFVAERGGEAFRSLMHETVPVVEYRLVSRLAGLDLTEPEAQTRALRACLPVLAQVKEDAVRNEYTKWLAGKTRLDDHIVFWEVAKALKGEVPPGPAGIKQTSTQARREREALKLALQHPGKVAEHVARLEPDDFTLKAHRVAWELIRRGETDPASAPEPSRELFTRLSMESVEGVASTGDDPGDRLIDEIFLRLEESALTRKINEVKGRLEKLNPVADPAGYDAIFKELVDLEAARRKLSSDETEGA